MSYIPRAEKQAILKLLYWRDGPFCCWCDRQLIVLDEIPSIGNGKLPRNYPTIEHMIKREHNGANRPFNYKLACPGCNTKRDKRMRDHSRLKLAKQKNPVV